MRWRCLGGEITSIEFENERTGGLLEGKGWDMPRIGARMNDMIGCMKQKRDEEQ
jgi:hypothetical protein